MKPQRWFLVLPPDGAARSVGTSVINAFKNRLPPENFKTFDTLSYREYFNKLLNHAGGDTAIDLLNQSLAISCLDFQATYFLVLALSPVTLFTLNLLKRQSVLTLHWFYEDYRRAPYWKDVIAGYDHFCAIQRGPLPEACVKAGAAYHFLPTATAFCDRTPANLFRKYDVAFIGVPSPYRIAILERLARQGFSLAIAGRGWQAYHGILQKMIINGKWTAEDESFKILSQAKIGINLSLEEPGDRAQVHISPRAYDILAAGALLVSEEVPLLGKSLAGCSYHAFRSADESCAVVKLLLSSYDSFASDSEQTRRIVLRDHTWENRVEEIINYVLKG
jgi:spore maturation protein CgeB